MSVRHLYTLLATGRISPRRASIPAYISSLLLRSLTAIDNDQSPNSRRTLPDPPSLDTLDVFSAALPATAGVPSSSSTAEAQPLTTESLDLQMDSLEKESA